MQPLVKRRAVSTVLQLAVGRRPGAGSRIDLLGLRRATSDSAQSSQRSSGASVLSDLSLSDFYFIYLGLRPAIACHNIYSAPSRQIIWISHSRKHSIIITIHL